MKNTNYSDVARELFLVARSILMMIGLMIVLHGCEETMYTPKDVNEMTAQQGRRPKNPPPPVYFYFTNCGGYPSAITGNFVAGTPTTASATFNYINSPGGSHPAYTSIVVNGVRLSAPAGTLSVGSGSITFTASGTPITPGSITIPVAIGTSLTCNYPITVLNPPPSGNCSDPGAAVGSTGCVDFTYRGQTVKYATVRAGDGKIWLRQNLGSPQVAVNSKDQASFGHYFQWGRWDDGHQLPNSTAVTGSSSLQNPSHIPSGNPNFIKGSTAATAWWGTGGLASNSWSGTVVTATNGKDPCVAIGPGWHLPSAAEWTNFQYAEAINDEFSAFESTLKLTLSGRRDAANATVSDPVTQNWGYYWSATAGNNTASVFFIDTYETFIHPSTRGYGFSCRCVKN